MAVKNYEAWSAAIERVVPNSYHARWSPGDLKVAVGNDNRRLLMRLSASEKVSTFRYARALRTSRSKRTADQRERGRG